MAHLIVKNVMKNFVNISNVRLSMMMAINKFHQQRNIVNFCIQNQSKLPLIAQNYNCYNERRLFASYGKDLPPVDPKEIELRVFKTLATHDKIDPNNVKISSHLANDLGLDSLDQVEIVVALEDEFDLSIEDVDAEKLHTVKDIVDFIVTTLQTKPDPRQNPGAKYDPNMEFGPN